MRTSIWIRQHLAALRALLVMTVILGVAYPAAVWAVAQVPGLRDKAEGSIIEVNGEAIGSELIGQNFTDSDGNPLPQYFQSRPSAAGDGYDLTSTSASNLGPESIQDTLADPALIAAGTDPADAGYSASLLTTVCARSVAVGDLEGVDGSRPFCTSGGVGAVLSVIGPRDSHGNVVTPTKVISVNEACSRDPSNPVAPFIATYKGVKVECAEFGEDYAIGQLVPIRGSAPAEPAVPADAVTASGSGLDPHISPAYADLQADRVAKARGISVDQVRDAIDNNETGRALGFIGEPTVNALMLNVELDTKYPVSG